MSTETTGLNLPEDTHLAYIVWHEAWYYDATRDTEAPSLMVSASAEGSGGGVGWEFKVESYELGGHSVTRVLMFQDSYAAFTGVPAFFAALAEQEPVTLDEVRTILDALGAVDETPRISPYPDRQQAARVTYSLDEVRDGTGWPRGVRFALVREQA